MDDEIFQNLFVLELSNNHLGDVSRGKKIITDFSSIIKANSIKGAFKLQLRDSDNFVHKNFLSRTDIRYINKILKTKMSLDDYAELVQEIIKSGCVPMATPFDEKSVKNAIKLGIQIFKIASSDLADKSLIEEVA